MGTNIWLISDSISFTPVQNKNLSWIFSIMDFIPPIIVMIFIDLLALIIVFGMHRYLVFFYGDKSILFNVSQNFSYAGIICAFIDIAISFVCIVIGCINRSGTVNKATKKQRGIVVWVQRAFPEFPE